MKVSGYLEESSGRAGLRTCTGNKPFAEAGFMPARFLEGSST
jgi:hypothetical protein